jgi:Reverse transcriptase (RNA-dependent DNA polymerase)
VTHFDLKLHQIDFKITFLNGNIDEYIYMSQLLNYESDDSKQMVCKLKKSIYGLKQASQQFYFKFHQVIISFGFEPNLVDECIYHKFSESKFTSNDKNIMRETKKILFKHFYMKDLSETSYVLGLKIHRD